MQTLIPIYILVFLYGIVIGSFVNVCIYRIPLGEDIVKTSSHCMNCGHTLKWYDLFPVFSFLVLGGKCRYCKSNLSIQYPVIEVVNGILYCLIVGVKGVNINSVLYCLFASALLTLGVIDFRTMEIPVGINYFILILGLIHLGLNGQKFWDCILGFFSVSAGLFVLYQLTGGRGIGGGDIKLVAVSGLLLGGKANILAFLLACILGSVIHSLRMKITKADHVLALGPYLAAGMIISLLWGEEMIRWYMNLFF